MFIAVATDGVRTQTTKGTNLQKLVAKCLDAEETYGADTHIENSAGSIVWASDLSEIEQESFDLVVGG